MKVLAFRCSSGGPLSCKSATPSRTYGIFRENFCKRVGEFATWPHPAHYRRGLYS